MDEKNQVEALLFSSGKFMSEENLSLLIGADIKEIRKALKALKDEYAARDSSLTLVQENNTWKVNVREKYLDLVRKIVADTELPKSVLETLAIIAWKNPVQQSDVVNTRGNKAYEHIAQLEEMGFINKEKSGRSFKLKLAEKFFEYFDVEGTKDIKEIFKNVKIPKPDNQTTLNEPTQTEEKITVDNREEQMLEISKEEEKIEDNQPPLHIPEPPKNETEIKLDENGDELTRELEQEEKEIEDKFENNYNKQKEYQKQEKEEDKIPEPKRQDIDEEKELIKDEEEFFKKEEKEIKQKTKKEKKDKKIKSIREDQLKVSPLNEENKEIIKTEAPIKDQRINAKSVEEELKEIEKLDKEINKLTGKQKEKIRINAQIQSPKKKQEKPKGIVKPLPKIKKSSQKIKQKLSAKNILYKKKPEKPANQKQSRKRNKKKK
ncbi:MAG: SMC-Scp complex subunit ScpB [Candidatus Woesearchaeota archaeon]